MKRLTWLLLILPALAGAQTIEVTSTDGLTKTITVSVPGPAGADGAAGPAGPAFTGGTLTTAVLGAAANNCAAPPFSFDGDATTGVCSTAAGTMNLYTTGVSRLALTSTAATFTGPVFFDNGTSAAPSIAWASDADGTGTGLYRPAINQIGMVFNGVTPTIFGAGYAKIQATAGAVMFGVADDLSISRYDANKLQVGFNAPLASMNWVKGPDSTGSGQAGGNLKLAGGDGLVDAANGGNLILQGGALHGAGAAGVVMVADNGTKPTCVAALRGAIWYDEGGAGVDDFYAVCVKTRANTYEWSEFSWANYGGWATSLALTDAGAAVPFARIAVPTNGWKAGELQWTATSLSGADQLVANGAVRWWSADTAGTPVCGINKIGTDGEGHSGGVNTLVCTWTNVQNTTNCDLSVTCTNDLAAVQAITLYGHVNMQIPGGLSFP